MTPAEQLYAIAKTLPDETILALLNLLHSLGQPNTVQPQTLLTTSQPAAPRKLPPGTLTGLRGIAKQLKFANTTPQDDYTDYLIEKYQ